jgi:uncharacterized membrane protein YeiH
MSTLPHVLGASSWADRSLDDFTIVDLIAATTFAFNAALIVRRPDHWKHYTVVGIILFALIGGVAGGVSRDLLLGKVPAALSNPLYLVLPIAAALLAIRIEYYGGQRFREGLYQFVTSLAAPWYAAVGANAALGAGLPYLAAVVIGVISATAGRYIVDLTAGVTPKHFVRGEWFVGTAVLASVVYVVCDAGLGLSIWPATLISFTVGFVFRYAAMLRRWEEPEPWAPPELQATEAERPRIQDQLRAEFPPDDR